MPGWSRIPSTTSRPPLTRLTTPGGSPSPSSTSKAICWVSGTCSEGLSTNVLPQPIAKGRNQNGTIAGKLKGTIAAHTPTGWRIVSASTLRATSSRMRPCIVVGIAHAASTISIMRATSARRVDDRLAHLGRHRARELLLARLEPLAQREEQARAADDADRAPLGQRGARGAHGGVEVRRRRQRDAGQHLAGGGVGDVELVGAGGRRPLAADVVVEQTGGRGGGSAHRSIHSWSGSLAMAQARRRAGHHVEVVEVVARAAPRPCGSRAGRARESRSPNASALVERAVVGVDALQAEAVRRGDAVVVRLLQEGLARAGRRGRACAAGSWTSARRA